MLEYVREYHRHDPHVPYVASRPIGDVVHTEDVFSRTEYANHPFYREFWTPYNVRSFLGAKVAEDVRYVSVIGMMRSLDVAPYNAQEINLVRRYYGHLAAAMRISQFLSRVKAVALVGYGLMESSERPMFLLTAGLQIVAANTAVRHYLGKGTFTVRNEALHCPASENQSAMDEALKRMFTTLAGESEAGSKRTAVRLKQKGSTDMLCSLWRLKPEETMGAFGIETLALLTVAVSDAGRRADPLMLASMFDLTPAETKVALAMMDGADVSEIAARNSVSVATIHSQLQSLFAKTGTGRQAKLVQLLLSAVAL